MHPGKGQYMGKSCHPELIPYLYRQMIPVSQEKGLCQGAFPAEHPVYLFGKTGNAPFTKPEEWAGDSRRGSFSGGKA